MMTISARTSPMGSFSSGIRTKVTSALLLLAVAITVGLWLSGSSSVVVREQNPSGPGGIIVVNANGDFQRALTVARPGDTVVLQAGAIYTGPFVLPNKSGSSFITIQSSAVDSLPAGQRVSPANSVLMPKLVSPGLNQAVISTAAGAHHYQFIGIEFAPVNATAVVSDLVKLGDGSSAQNSLVGVAHHLILDRCYIHGFPTQEVKRGVALNSGEASIINSYISDIHGVGYDTQAICGWNGPGPYHIINNYLEAAGENVMFGGADPAIAGLIPSDIEIRRNTFFKPLSWKVGDPSYGGKHWTVKNLFELKNARRVVVDGNTFENSWLDAQVGFALLIKSQNQDGGCQWCVSEDITISNNIIRNVEHGINVLAYDPYHPSAQVKRLRIVNNLWENIRGMWFQGTDGADDVLVEHNTHLQQSGNVMTLYGRPISSFVVRNNVGVRTGYGIKGDGTAEGTAALATYGPAYVYAKNVLIGAPATQYPAANFYPTTVEAVGFVDPANGNYRLSESSPYNNAGTDGKDLGVDFEALEAAMGASSTIPTPTPTPTPTPSPNPTSTPTPTPGTSTPTTSITSPTGGAQYSETATITINAVATDVDGAVVSVEFFSGTTLLGSDLTAPYSFVWSGVTAGSYTLTTKAIDNSGRNGTSAEVRVQVKRATGSVNRAKKNAQSASNQLADSSTSGSATSSDTTQESSSAINRLAAVVADIEHAYDDFRLEQSSYVVAGKIDIELQNALNYARIAESSAASGMNPAVEQNLRKAINFLELASVHMVHGDVPNPLAVTEFFVRQHYVDFLNREPDEAGLNFWAAEIARCGDNAQCTQVARINVSAAFFLSIEFRESGYLAYRLYKASYGQMPALTEFSADSEELRRGVIVGQTGWTEKIEANKVAFYQKWVGRPTFIARYGSLSNSAFVDALLISTSATVNPAERNSWVAMLNAGGSRAVVLRRIVEREEFARNEVNSAFVMMQYIGYLRRDPDAGGFNFWLNKLNQFGGDYNRAEMVRAFIESIEYNERFANR